MHVPLAPSTPQSPSKHIPVAFMVLLLFAPFARSGEDMTAAHTQAKNKPRRIIFNNDGDDAIYFAKEATPEGLWAVRGAPIVGSQVDTMSYCVNIGLGMFRVPVPFGDLLTRDGKEGTRNITDELAAQGTDALEVMAGRCRPNNIELFVSFRMNDIHDGVKPEWTDLFLSQWKRDHPELLHGSPDNKPPFGYWSGADYAQSDVRDYVCAIIEHFCTHYDVDGVELDFWRHPPHFRTCAWGKPATQDERALMTAMLRRIRAMTRRVAHDRNRPLLVAVRMLESVEMSLDQGLDIAAWLRDDLIDLLITGEFSQDKWPDLIALGHAYDVPVFPGLRRNLPLKDGYLESLRGQAFTAHHLGASGVYLFNLFPEAIQAQFGSLEPFLTYGDIGTLAAMDKVYSFSRADDIMHKYLHHGVEYFPSPSIGRGHPFDIPPEQGLRLALHVWEDDPATEQAPSVRIRAAFEDLSAAAKVTFMLNGSPCARESGGEDETHALYRCEHASLRQGANLMGLKNQSKGTIRLNDLRLLLAYSP